MVVICGWCSRYLCTKGPATSTGVSHGICAACSKLLLRGKTPTLVVSRELSDLAPLIEGLLSQPCLRVVVDRREESLEGRVPTVHHPDRRRGTAALLA